MEDEKERIKKRTEGFKEEKIGREDFITKKKDTKNDAWNRRRNMKRKRK